MSVTLSVCDETVSGSVYHEVPLVFPSERISVRELIRERVYQEVQDFNRRKVDQAFRGLVQPTHAESVLNGNRTEYRMKPQEQIEWKSQFEKAIEGFQQGGFLVLIDDKQADDLDQEFIAGAGTRVSFVKLTLLIGG